MNKLTAKQELRDYFPGIHALLKSEYNIDTHIDSEGKLRLQPYKVEAVKRLEDIFVNYPEYKLEINNG